MRPRRGDGLLSTEEAAALAGVSPSTIRDWRSKKKGYLRVQGLDERGRPLHTREAVQAAEKRAVEAGLKASGINPRKRRRAFPVPEAA
jgi:transposase